MLLRLQLADCQTCVTSISELSLRGFNLFAQWREPGVLKTRIRGLIIRNNYFIIDCVNECDPFLGLEHLPPKNVHMPDDSLLLMIRTVHVMGHLTLEVGLFFHYA